MKCLSAKGLQRRSGVVTQLIRFRLEPAAVDLVAQQWVSDRGEVDADLVRAPGLEPAGNEARDRRAVAPPLAFEYLPMRDRRAAARAHRHLLARVRVAADRLVDGAARALRYAPDKGEIAAGQRLAAPVVGKLPAQRAVRAVGLGHHQEAARILVEPVHDAGALDAADAGEAFPA